MPAPSTPLGAGLPALLREAGESLFGSQWQSELARGLDVSVRTVQRWAQGTYPVPDGVWADLRALGDRRSSERAAGWRELRDRLP